MTYLTTIRDNSEVVMCFVCGCQIEGMFKGTQRESCGSAGILACDSHSWEELEDKADMLNDEEFVAMSQVFLTDEY